MKMKTEMNSPIHYFLELEKDIIFLNDLIGSYISLDHLFYQCIHCKIDEEIYGRGYCKKCFFSLPQANLSIMKPHLSKAHLGIKQRDLEWEKSFELSPHIVYLSDTAIIKVGVTRESQIPIRWMDQGALKAIKLARTPNRYLAGAIEIALSKILPDKTPYKKMLTYQKSTCDLIKMKYQIKDKIPLDNQIYFTNEDELFDFIYPIENHPSSIKTIQLKTSKSFKKKLVGIKGQYLIFEDGNVLNIRAHQGFYVRFSI